ncbi:uncharacterized protein LOC105155636 [Sesamum indicum]|uniref:Uncharacterized protein LOC105155636 n=1 Tax=Sesamum indicum TaxID=4182 RepID=A0A6I9SJ47_SESIN|nr:uncharacterized protein LOC105155636 [Sesamum indicum]XP_011069840.1 uncharacterized protein LOC105155636 [Sesamum indicum]
MLDRHLSSQQHTLRRLQLRTYPQPVHQPPKPISVPPTAAAPLTFPASVCSIHRSFRPPMGRPKAVSDALHIKNKPILKRRSRRKQLTTAFKKVFNYMKSDTYMFAPLAYPQPRHTSSSVSFDGEVVSFEPIKGKEKELVKDVEEYLRCDCYMYSPLFLDSDSRIVGVGGRRKGDIGTTVCDEIEPAVEERRRQDQDSTNSLGETDDTYNPVRRIAVRHIMLRKENLKHVVKRNCRPSSSAGKVPSQKDSRKITVE